MNHEINVGPYNYVKWSLMVPSYEVAVLSHREDKCMPGKFYNI